MSPLVQSCAASGVWIRAIPDRLRRGKMLARRSDVVVVLRPNTFLEFQFGLPFGVILLVPIVPGIFRIAIGLPPHDTKCASETGSWTFRMSSSVRLVGNRVPLPPLYRSHTRGLPGLFLGGSSVCSSVVKEIAGILERVIQVRWPYCLNDRLC